MSGTRLTILTLALAAPLVTSAARAADYQPPPPQVYVQPPQVIEGTSGWYLRGYIGMSSQKAELFHPSFNEKPYTHIDDGFDSAPFFGVGVGYYFNEWLRFDVTGEYRGSANYHGYGIYPGGSDEYRARKSELVGLVNAYADLGTWWCVTPFIGVGVGGAYNTISSFLDINTPTGGVYSAQQQSMWNFAWALHAGLAYKVTPGFTVELAYRYLDLGKAETGTGVSFDGTNANGRPFQFNHLTSHDFMLGVRFNLDSLGDYARPVRNYSPPLRSKG
jgi:opacity protein-like surface antigen